MEVKSRKFTEFISGNKQFVIPVFQRDYSWQAKKHCAQLFRDVVRAGARRAMGHHFLGAIVCIPSADHALGFPKGLVIDGQQRLATLILLLAAMRDHIRDRSLTSVGGLTAEQIHDYYLTNRHLSGIDKYRLLLRSHDQEALRRLIDGKPDARFSKRAIQIAYTYFLDEIAKAGDDPDPDQIMRGIHALGIVEVTLNPAEDDPQAIFESLNATGLELKKSDLIRNSILMRLSESEQTAMYSEYWKEIEDLFRGHDRVFDNFARDYLDLKKQNLTQTRTDDIYPDFREYWIEQRHDRELDSALSDMVRHARHYAALRIGPDSSPAREDRYRRLRQLRASPAITVMWLLEWRHSVPSSTERDYLACLDLIESYLVRRAVCGWSTRAYDKVFAFVTAKMDHRDPLTALKVAFFRRPERYDYPDDDDFRKALVEDDLYHRRVCKLVLDRLENDGSKEPSETSQYTIEHVLPQSPRLSREWTEMLGDDWPDIQQTWMHRLGNLTLTGYNAEYSDRPFDEKKTMTDGFADSAVRLNRFINEQSVWTEEQIRARTERLADQALSIWSPLRVSQDSVDAAILRDRREEAAGRSVRDIRMSDHTAPLFKRLQRLVLDIADDITEITETKSVSYHRARYFLEVVPQRNRLHLLLAPEFDSLISPPAKTQNLRTWTYVAGSRYKRDSGSIFSVTDNEDTMDAALELIRQAYDAAG